MVQRLLGNLQKGLMFVVSAPAGTGKTTLVQRLVKEFSGVVVASISSTTRAPRGTEVNGIDYHFLSQTEFVDRAAKGEFLEHVQLYGDYYGTSRIWLEQQLDAGKHVILVIDTQGALLLQQKLEAIYIFIAPPSLEVLEQRLKARKTESQEAIQRRLDRAKDELKVMDAYDYLIVNDQLDVAYHALRSIVIAEEHRIR